MLVTASNDGAGVKYYTCAFLEDALPTMAMVLFGSTHPLTLPTHTLTMLVHASVS